MAAVGACLLFQTEGKAQPFSNLGTKIRNTFTGYNPKLDSVFVFQPFRGWDFSLTYKGRWDGVNLEIPIVVDMGNIHDEPTIHTTLVDNLSNHVGVRGGYGPLSIGFSVAVSGKRKGNRNFSFNWITNSLNLQVYHARILDTATSVASYPDREDMALPDVASKANIWRVSAYYAFNHRKFSYPAVYSGKMVQRKSAGSFMVGAKFHYSNLLLDDGKNPVSALMLNLRGYTTNQFSLGAGYSFNWVLFHRDAAGRKDIGDLRNLTFNITAIPLVTVVNNLRMTHYSENHGNVRINMRGYVQPNFLSRAGICYAIGHLYITSYFDFHFNRFRTSTITEKELEKARVVFDGYTSYHFSVTGKLANWSGGLDLHYRF